MTTLHTNPNLFLSLAVMFCFISLFFPSSSFVTLRFFFSFVWFVCLFVFALFSFRFFSYFPFIFYSRLTLSFAAPSGAPHDF